MDGERDHARYSASSYYRWSVCHGSVRLSEAVPAPPSSVYARRGTAAHGLIEFSLRNAIRSAAEAAQFSTPRLIAEQNEVELDAEIIRGAQAALDYAYEILDANPDAQIWIEERVQLPVQSAPGQAWGTSDIIIFLPSTGTLHVIDYKNGVDPVEVIGNGQVRFYAVGAMVARPSHVIRRVVVTIVQPNAFHRDGPIRSEELDPVDLELFLMEVDANIAMCEAPDAALVPGVKQCRWCPAAPTCPALQARALSVVGNDFEGVDVRTLTAKSLPEPRTLGLDRLAYIMQAAPLLKTWLKEVESYAFELAKGGTPMPGFKLVSARARRQWEGDPAQIAADLALLTGLDESEFYRPELIGITEAEALVVDAFKAAAPKGKKKDYAQKGKEYFAFCTTKDSTGTLTLVPLSDDRPAVSPVVNDFGGVSLPMIELTALQTSVAKD